MKVRIHRGAAEIGGSCVELEAESLPSIPQPHWERVAVLVTQQQRSWAVKTGQLHRLNRIHHHRTYTDRMATDPGRHALVFRGSMAGEVARSGLLAGGRPPRARCLWSMWRGYLDGEWWPV